MNLILCVFERSVIYVSIIGLISQVTILFWNLQKLIYFFDKTALGNEN
jgi:hypothetical protein